MPVVEHRASDFLQSLADIEEYLAAAVEDKDEDPRLLSIALRNVAARTEGITEFQMTAILDSLLSRKEFQNQARGSEDRTFFRSHAFGRMDFANTGFFNPVDMAIATNGSIYVVNRPYDYRPDGMPLTVCAPDNDSVRAFGAFGEADGEFVCPTGVALDRAGNVYVADEWLNRVTKFTPEGEYVNLWGAPGSGAGELNGPAGLAIDSRGRVLVVDSKNNRVQRFTLDGQYIASFGSVGSGPGQFDSPWGIGLDKEDNIYVADWRNDRIQVFSSNGEWRKSIGSSGDGIGEFNRPSGVAVDTDGDIYVSGCMNNRVHVFDSNGRFIRHLSGDAKFSGRDTDKLYFEPSVLQQEEPAFSINLGGRNNCSFPLGVRFDNEGRIAIMDPVGGRIHVYVKGSVPGRVSENTTVSIQV